MNHSMKLRSLCLGCVAWLLLRLVVMLACCAMLLVAIQDAQAAGRGRSQARQGRPPEGILVHVQGDEHVIDIGHRDGLRAGTRVRLYRTVRVRHPVTGKKLRDRFEVGEVGVSETADHMAVLVVPKTLAARLRPGDPVVVLRPRPAPPVTPRPGSQPRLAAGPALASISVAEMPRPSADEVAVERLFVATLGRQPAERITMWRAFLAEHGDSPLAAAIRREIDAMAELGADQRRLQRGQLARRRLTQQRQAIQHRALPPLRVGEPAWVVLTSADWSAAADARIYFRARGAGVFKMLRAEHAGLLHRRAQLPAAIVASPGFEYFAVVTDTSGAMRHLAGDAKVPRFVPVSDTHHIIEHAKEDATTLRWITEYVDFNRMRADDRVLMSELSVAYRLDHGRLHAFDMGYGFLNGMGGRVADGGEPTPGGGVASRGDTLNSRRASFKYAWLGTDWRFNPMWHGIVRLVLGLDEQGLDTGIELLTRIGTEKGTSLQLGISALADTGRAASVALTTHVVPKVPMTGVFEVTNRPVGEDPGIRLVYQADFELTDALALTGRASYALRTINHAGFGLGAGLALNW